MNIDQEESRISATYTTRLDRTLKDLEDRVREQELALQDLRASTTSISTLPSQDPKIRLNQICSLQEAYESLTSSQPYLPPLQSPLPALIAHRSTSTCITSTQCHILTTQDDLRNIHRLLQEEQSDLAFAQEIQSSLRKRIDSLRFEIHQKTQKTPTQIARDLRATLKSQTAAYDTSTAKLVRAFNTFIDSQLSLQLAAEELGGPIVGEMLDISPVTLSRGFSAQGKPKKSRTGLENSNPNSDKRQRRINEIWGPSPHSEGQEQEWNERTAAAAEMRELAEQLLNGLLDKEESGTGGYVEIERESAAARFLVRSKVAQFHYGDARRLRLVDFEKEIE